MDAPPIDSAALRKAFGTYATGVVVIGARGADGMPVGMTVNSFSSVSIAPPLVSFCPGRSSFAFPVYAAMQHFSVSVLGEEHRGISDRFARASGEHKWGGVKHRLGEGGVPVLEDAVAAFECEVEARFDAGDHVIVLGRVLRFEHNGERSPLLFHGSRYHGLGAGLDSPQHVDLASLIGWG
ncbi:MAG: flavin reductase family protein [Burkholderiales bacterium]